jgi:hypothetical protein
MPKQTFLAAGAAAVALTVLAVTPQATAQNYNAEPNYGTVRLVTGFLPDPRVIALRAGGDRPAARINSRCRGYITRNPDVRLHYRAGDTFPLIISANSRTDTTLVVNAPDGSWHCNDDGGVGAFNPSIRFESPTSGRYEIWVGTYNPGPTAPARLHISELRSR